MKRPIPHLDQPVARCLGDEDLRGPSRRLGPRRSEFEQTPQARKPNFLTVENRLAKRADGATVKKQASAIYSTYTARALRLRHSDTIIPNTYSVSAGERPSPLLRRITEHLFSVSGRETITTIKKNNRTPIQCQRVTQVYTLVKRNLSIFIGGNGLQIS